MRVFAASVLIVVLLGCGSAAPAARVGSSVITAKDLDAELEALTSNAQFVRQEDVLKNGKITKATVLGTLTRRIRTVLLEGLLPASAPADVRAEATRTLSESVGGKQVFDAFPDGYRTRLIDDVSRVEALKQSLRPTSPEQWYAQHVTDFERTCARHILVAQRAEADDVAATLRGGGSFADIAKARSLDTGTAPRGGDLGCNPRGDLTGAVERAVWSQAPGVIGEPVETESGWQVVLVERRYTPPLQDVRGEVDARLVALSERGLADLLRKQAKSKAVTVDRKLGRWDASSLQVVA